jgi:hypothetical protein
MDLRSRVEREVDAIRLAIYEETKDMTTEQINEYYRKSGEAAAKKYGFKVAPGVVRATSHHPEVTTHKN